VESHDDRTWLDNITENHDFNGAHPAHNDLLRSHMMAALLYTSLGVPMLSSGQDFMRSKGGIHNSYQMGELNALNYDRVQDFSHTHEYFKSWIAFRNSDWGQILRLEKNPGAGYLRVFTCDNSEHSSAALLFNADSGLGSQQVLLALNPHSEDCRIHLYDVAGDGWLPIADIWNFDATGITDERLNRPERNIYLGPMSLGLWVRA